MSREPQRHQRAATSWANASRMRACTAPPRLRRQASRIAVQQRGCQFAAQVDAQVCAATGISLPFQVTSASAGQRILRPGAES